MKLRRETAAVVAARFTLAREARAKRELATRDELARLLAAGMQRCAACGDEKPRAEFYLHRRYESRPRCMRCDIDSARDVEATGKRRRWRDGRTNVVLWTAKSLALLGTATDRVVAQRLGSTESAVFRKRRALGIAAYKRKRRKRKRRRR